MYSRSSPIKGKGIELNRSKPDMLTKCEYNSNFPDYYTQNKLNESLQKKMESIMHV